MMRPFLRHVTEATGRPQSRIEDELGDDRAIVLGSGNLGLIYLMEEERRLTMEEIESATRSCSPRSPSTRTSVSYSSVRSRTVPWR